MKSMKKHFKNLLPNNVTVRTCYRGKKLSSCFQVKDKTKEEHEHNLIYHVKCPVEDCDDDYIGEAGRRVVERVKDHGGRDHSSHMFKHSLEKSHQEVKIEDFTIIGRNFKNKRKRKVAEALLIKELKPTLNVQEQSVVIKLLN